MRMPSRVRRLLVQRLGWRGTWRAAIAPTGLARMGLALGAVAALFALVALSLPPAHADSYADGGFQVTLAGTQSLSQTVPTASGNSVRRVDFQLRTSGGYPRLAISVTQGRETLYPSGQTQPVIMPDGSRPQGIGVVDATGSATDPIGGTLLFDLRVRGAILPDHTLALQLVSPTTDPNSRLTMSVTFPDSEARAVSGTASGTLVLGPNASPTTVSDVWGAQTAAQSGTQTATDPTLWYLTRGAAATAYLLLVAVVALGIALGFQGFAGLVPGWRIYDLHQALTLAMLGFIALHLATLYLDPFKPFSLLQLVWPLAETYRPIWNALGVLATYLALVVTASSYLRRAIGSRVWFVLHLVSYIAFVLLTLHGIFAGTDTTTPWMLGVYTSSCGLVLALTLGRVYFALTAGGARGPAPTVAGAYDPAESRR